MFYVYAALPRYRNAERKPILNVQVRERRWGRTLGCSEQQNNKKAVQEAMAMLALQRGAATTRTSEDRSEHMVIIARSLSLLMFRIIANNP